MAVPGSRPFHGRALTFARGSDQIRRALHNCRVRITVACAPNADRPHARETGTVVTRLAADMTFTKSPAEEAADNPHCIQPSASTKPIAAESLVVSSNMRPRRGRDATQHVVPLPMVPGGGENVPRDLQSRGPFAHHTETLHPSWMQQNRGRCIYPHLSRRVRPCGAEPTACSVKSSRPL